MSNQYCIWSLDINYSMRDPISRSATFITVRGLQSCNMGHISGDDVSARSCISSP